MLTMLTMLTIELRAGGLGEAERTNLRGEETFAAASTMACCANCMYTLQLRDCLISKMESKISDCGHLAL